MRTTASALMENSGEDSTPPKTTHTVVRPRHGLDSPCHARSRIVGDLACVPFARHARPCTVRPDAQRVMAQMPSGTVLVLAT